MIFSWEGNIQINGFAYFNTYKSLFKSGYKGARADFKVMSGSSTTLKRNAVKLALIINISNITIFDFARG